MLGEGTWEDSSMLEAAMTRVLAAERESPDSGYELLGRRSGL